MALSDLAAGLRALAPTGAIPLDAATLTAGTGLTLPGGYDALVAAALGLSDDDKWTLAIDASAIPDASATDLHITAGTSTLAGLNLSGVGVDLLFHVPENSSALEVTAAFALPADWTFAASFPSLAGYPFDPLALASPSLIFASQALDGYAAPAGPVHLEPGLNFAGLLSLGPVFGQILAFIAPSGAPYVFSGTIDVSASPFKPAVALRAKLAGTLAQLGPLQIQGPFVDLRTHVKKTPTSTVLVYGVSLDIGSGLEFDFTTQILRNPHEMVFGLAAQGKQEMTPDAVFALIGGQSWGDGVPGPLRGALQTVALKDISVRTTLATPPALTAMSLTLGSTGPIAIFDDLTIDSFDLLWWLDREGDGWTNELRFAATFDFYPDLFKGGFDVEISSALQIWGSFSGDVSLAALLEKVTGGVIALPSSTDLTLNDFQLALDIPGKSFSLYMAANAVFDPLGTGLLELGAVQLTLQSAAGTSGRTYAGSLEAVLLMAGMPLAVSAAYATGAGWDFAAAMPAGTSVSIRHLLQRLFPGAGIPDFLDKAGIANLQLTAHSGGTAPGSIGVAATIHVSDVDLGALGTYTFDADFALRHTAGAAPTTDASFQIATLIPGINAHVAIGYAFTTAGGSEISLAWGPLLGTYSIGAKQIAFSAPEATLGGILGQMVGLIIGDDSYRLPAPWSVLNELSLRGFRIVWHLDTKTVELDYPLPSAIDLGFITISGVKIEKKGKVKVTLDATFIGGETVPPFDPLDQPPATPGGSPIDLRLLALGQRVKPDGLDAIATVDGAIRKLASFSTTPASGLPAGPVFAADVPWLVGVHLFVMGKTVEIEIVFIDPLLYGARIALSGPKAGPFAGLDFEILYKRITDTIGVYQIRLTLPTQMQTLQFGAVTVMLPSVALDIYTNGDFRIDFGFPTNMDFSKSFGIQLFPFTGAGGFYFARLSAATQTQIGQPSVPGSFDPVIEFGLGLQVGLGKDISAGILKAGVSLTVFGMVEGIIARWVPSPPPGLPALPGHAAALAKAAPDPRDVGSQYYYRISGTIGIIGIIYGSIDFAIIKASLNLTVTISLQAVIEAHQPLLVSFTANVSVSLSVDINLGLFSITIHLSFSMTVSESFTIGQNSDAPWGTLGPPSAKALRARQRLAARQATPVAPNFRPFADTAEARAEIDLTFVMHPTVASDPADASTAAGKLVAMLYVDAPDPSSTAPPLPPIDAPLAPAPTSFERFAEAVFLWAVASFGGSAGMTHAAFASSTITEAQIETAYRYLTGTTNQRPISYDDDIVPGLFPGLRFVVTAGAILTSASPFPMIPQLTLAVGDLTRSFDDGLQVDATYLDGLSAFFGQIAARYQNEAAGAQAPPLGLRTTRSATTSSFSAAMFEDIVLMLARGMTRGALDVMDGFAYPYDGTALSAVVKTFHDFGNTIAAGELAAANAELPLTGNLQLTITNVRHQFAATDSFASVTRGYGVTDAGAVLADPANATQNAILRPGVTLTGGARPYTTVSGDTFESIAGTPGWSYALLAQALQDAPTAILPLAVLQFAAISYATGPTDTIASVARAFDRTSDALGDDIAGAAGLFSGTPMLTVPDIASLPADVVLGRMRAKEVTAHLAGANARFLLNGVRPPAPPAAPNPGVPAALYDLNGQQIDLPSATEATLSIATTETWIRFPSGQSVTLDVTEALALAQVFAGLVKEDGVPVAIDTIAALPTYEDRPRRFTLRRTAIVQSAEAPAYPVQSQAPAGTAVPRLWFVPDGMAAALAEPRAIPPAFTLEATSSGTPPRISTVGNYEWATLVDVEIKRRSDLPNVYDVFGSNEAGAALLAQMITPGATAAIFAIRVLAGANATGQVPTGYVDPGLSKVRAYLVKTNLSTDTNPQFAFAEADAVAPSPPSRGILNDSLEFARLLWEASVTRNGGFAFTYRHDDGTGLPDSLFAASDSATISFLLLHAADGAQVHPSVNAVLVGDGFDPSQYDLVAVSAAQRVIYTPDGTEGLADIAARYRIPLTTLAKAAADAPLAPGGPGFQFDDMLIDRVATIPPGNVGFTLARLNPGDGSDPATTLAKQFNLLDFSIAENAAFTAAGGALPIGPTRNGGAATRQLLHASASDDWQYSQVLYVANASRDAPAAGKYRGAGASAQIAFAVADMFGNLAASALTQPALAAALPQNPPLPVAYSDALLNPAAWPAIGATYRFYRPAVAAGAPAPSPRLELAFAFDPSRYVGDGAASSDPSTMPAWQQRALADRSIYATIVEQLSAPGVTMSLATSLDGGTAHAVDSAPFLTFAAAAAAYLVAVAAGTPPPPVPVAPTIGQDIAATNADDLFSLTVQIGLARPTAAVDPAFRGTGAESVTTPIAPQQATKEGATTDALSGFAKAFEDAYSGDPVFLKVLTGQAQRTGAESEIWVGRFRTAPGTASDPGIGFAAAPAEAGYYAPRPLANAAVSRSDVPILRFDPQTGVDWTASDLTAFAGVAMDGWGRTALAALDRFLSPDFAGAVFLIDHFDPDHNGYLAKILALKSDFADDIAATITPILLLPSPPADDSPAIKDARETMRQQILAKAENAYTVSAICQIPATVSSSYANDPDANVYAPRFYGAIAATPPGKEDAPSGPAQPWSLTVARPVLAPGAAFISSALIVVDPQAQSHLPLELDFKLTNVEHAISKGVDGEYLESSWLSFVIPFDAALPGAPRIDTTIGAVDIPVVLRVLPTAPALTAQAADQTPITSSDPAAALEQAKRWTYSFTYQKGFAAQDTIDCTVQFNTSDADPAPALVARPLDLLDHLGRFVTVWPAMLAALTEVLVPDRIDTDPTSAPYQRAQKLVSDFYRLLQPMPAAWRSWHASLHRQQHLSAAFGASVHSSAYRFSIQESAQGDPETSALIATFTAGTSDAQVWDPSTGQLVALPSPQLAVDDGETRWIGTPDPTGADVFTFMRDGETLSYAEARRLPSRSPKFLGLDDGLDVAAYQNAWAAVQVFRNRNLVRDGAGHWIPTTGAFVYQTAEIRFVARATPLIERASDFDVSALSTPALQPLATHLRAVANLLFEGTAPGTEQLIRFDGDYEQTLGPGLPPAVAPIFLGTPSSVTAEEAAGLMDNAAEYVRSWFSANTPPDGTLRFRLTLFPTLTHSRVPLLQLSNLVLARSQVSDLQFGHPENAG